MRAGMMAAAAAVALAGCAAFGNPAGGEYVAEALAGAQSFECAQRLVRRLDYTVVGFDGATEQLRAERTERDQAGSVTRAYLTVSVTSDGAPGEKIYARAERFVDESPRRIPGSARPPATWPQPTPTPYDTTGPGGRPIPRRQGPRRVGPGPAAEHARQIVRQCSVSGAAV
jgi:hypothetical protein